MAGKKSGMQVSVSAEDWKKSQGSGGSSAPNSGGINVSVSAEDWKKSGSPERFSGYNWEIDSFSQDANNFFRMAQRDNSGEKRFNAADYFEERKKQADALKQRAANISRYLEDNANLYTPDYYDSLMQTLSTFDTEVDDVLSLYQPALDSRTGMRAYEDELMAAMERNAQQKQWEQASDFAFEPGSFAANMMPLVRQKLFDEGDRGVKDNWSAEQRYRLGLMQMEDPNQAKDYAKEVNAGRDPYLAYQQQEQQKADWRAMDLNAERREIDRLKAELDDYYWNSNYDATSTNARNAFDQEVKRREKEISDREQQYNLAKREQDSAQFRSAADRSDFAARSGYVSTGFQMPNYVEDADPDELVYEYINNPEIRSQINQQTIELAENGYDLLEPEEVSLYNYYYATEGPAKAQQYLDNIQDTLNQRLGERGAASKDQLWKQLMAAAISGYSNAVTSPQYFFDKESDYINTSPFQYMSAAIREDLAGTGKHPFFDTSLGQMGYDLINTTANMLPSIMLSKGATAIMPGVGAAIGALGGKVTTPWLGSAISALGSGIAANAPQIGAAIGSSVMGLSAAGGAYQQALNAGYTKEQAKRYAALSGASEVALEYLLGGISKLGGEIPQAVLSNMVSGVDNAIARAAIELGGSMASEGFEEGLQEVITPWIENLTLYADKDVDWNEVAYSTLLGALSGGLMEGPAVVSNEIRSARANNLMELAKQKVEAEMATANMTAEQIEGMKPTTSADGNARQISRNESINVDGFAEVKEGNATVKLKEGGTVDYQDVSFSTDKQANQYFAVESLPVIDTAHANDLLKTIQDADVGNDTSEVVAIRESYRLGYLGATTQELRGSDAQILSTKLQDQIYNIGKEQRAANDAVRAAANTAPTKATAGYKKVVIEGKLSRVSRDAAKKRKAEIEYVDRIADTFAGTAVHVYESYKKNGKRYYKDNSGKEQLAPNGKYVNDEIWLDLNSGDNGEGLMLNTFAHEMYHHIEKWNKPKARELAEFVVKELGLESVDKAVAAQIEKARAAGFGEDHFKGMSPEQARNEVYMRAMSDFVADSLETMFTRGDPAKAIANLKKENKGLFDQIKAFIDEWISKVKKFYSDKTISQEGAAVAQLEKFEQLQQLFMEGMAGAGENYNAALEELTPGEAGIMVNADGEPVAMSTEDGSVMLSIRTYEEDGRKAFREYLNKCVTSNRLTEEQAKEMRDGIEEIYNTCKEFKDKYAPFSAWSDAEVIRDTRGRPVFSVVTPNGDYKMNLDFSLVCKKRRTLDAVFNEMSRRGIIDDFELGQKSVVKINEIIRKHGLETACALCFVDAKRFRQASMADSFARLYNELVESLVPEDQKSSIDHFNFSGYETIKKVDGGIDTWDNSRLDFSHLDKVMKEYGKGTGGPKAAFGDVQYLNEIIRKERTWTPSKAYEVGGIRIQSFSDYVPRMVFDYTQMIYDLAVRKLPAHAYTKETLFVKQFGLTGVKINMSLIPAVAKGGIAPGLDAKGNYVWAGESFNYDEAVKIQNAEGYSENCGTICVGVSKQHIEKLLRDPNIRMVIPYHKSGLNPIVAHMNKIAEFTDYTNDQRTKGKDGKAVIKDFNFNEAVKRTGDPKAAADEYLKWCADNGYTAKFAEFAKEDNYYKLLEDFTLYDKDGKYVPQREVRAVFPSEGSAFGTMKDLIKAGLEEDAIVEGKRDKKLSSIVDEIQKTLPKTEAEISEEQVKQADRDLEARYSVRGYMDSSGNMLTEAQQEYFKDSLARDENGNLLVLYHGTKKGGFTIYDPNLSKDGLFLTDRKEVARTYSGTEAEYAPKAGDPSTSGEMNYKVYADLRKPLIVDAKNAMWRKLPPLDPASTKFEYVKLLKYRNAKKSLFGKPFEIKLEVKERGKDSKVMTFDNYIACMNYIGNGFKEIIPDDGKPSVGKTFFDIGGENNWNTRQYCAYAKKNGYDGVIFRNIITPGSEAVNGQRNFVNTAVVAFDSKQIKSVENTTPTENPNFQLSLRNQQPTAREILTQIDTSTRNKHEANFLGKYQENLSTLAELEPRLEELNNQIAELSQDNKRVKELLAVQKEQRQVKASVNRLKGLVNAFERSDMGKRLVTEVRAKTRQEQDREKLKSYKDEQKKLIHTMQAEQRVIREELTGTRSVMSIMEDEFVRLAKDLEAKKIDLKTMEEKFLLVSKQYDKDTQKWLREYRSLMSKYRKLDAKNDRNLSKIEQLEKIILQQRQTAKEKVTSRRNTELRHKIQRKANELNQLLIHGTKHRNVPEYLQPAVADILNAINMEVRDGDQRRATYEATMARYDRRIAMTNDPSEVSRLIEKRNEYAAKGDQFANKMAKLKEAYQKIQDDKIPNMEIDEGLASRLMELFVVVGDTPLGQMTSEQLEAVNDVLNITKATVRNANEILAEERSVGVSEDSKATTMEVRRYGETKKQKTRMRKMFEQFGWNNLKPEHFFDVIGSKTLKARYETLRKGEDTLAVDLNEAKEFFQEQWKKNGGKEWDMEQKWKFTSTSGKSFELDLNQIMSLYALAKDNDARSHLRVGGFAFDSDYQTQKRGPLNIPIKVESTDASAYNLSDEILGEIISKLTPQQRAFADAMQAYLSDNMAAKGNEVSIKKYGIRLFKKKDYFPIRVADQFLAKAREQNAGDREIKNSGFTKDRKPEAKNPVVLSGFTEVWAEHVDEMSLYHSFVLPLDDFNRVLNYHDAFVEGEQAASVVEAITNAFGKGAVNYIDQLIKDVNGGIKGGSTVSFANSLVSKAKKAQTMASLSVAIQQPSSIIRAMSEVDSKYFFGPKVTEKSHDRTWNEIKAHAPIAIIKEMGGYDTNVGKSTVDYLIDTADYDGFGEKFKAMFTDGKFRDDALGRLPALMDEMSWGVIWNAVKREQRDLHPNMDTKSDAFMKLVANRFTEVITRTQVYDSVFSRSGLMRDRKSDLAKMITSFMAEPTTTANMLAVSILQAKRGDIPKKQAVKSTASIVASLALNAALVSVVYAMRDDDEDKRYDEKWIENFRNNFFESLNPLGYIPYVRDIYNLFAKGYDVERADMELFGDLQNAIEGLDNDDISAWEKTENVIGAIGNLLGVPVKNILRDVKGFVQTLGFAWDDRPNPKTKTGSYMAWRGMDLSDGEEMILAIQRGDNEHIQRVFGRFENQQQAESALQSAIRAKYVSGEMTAEEAEEMLTTNFDRDDEYEVYWLLEEWDYARENGSTDGYTKYGSLYEAIESGEYETEIARFMEHGADASTIRSQISKHYRKQYLEDETAREEIREKLLPVYEATGMYASDVEDKFNDWDFEAEYGMTYSNFKAEYREGNVTEAEMRSAMDFYGLLNYEIEEGIRELNDEIRFFNKYGMSISEMRDAYDNGDLSKNELINALVFTGKTRTEAMEEVAERDLERKYGIGYAKLDDAYKYNDISRSQFYNAMREHGATQQEADEAIIGYDWLKKNVRKYPDLAISDAKRFVIKVSDKMEERTLTDYGVSIDAYLQYKEGAKECPGVDADGDGQIDAYSKAKQLFAMIDKLPISDEAKDGLALITNAKSTLRKYAPWH